MELGLQNLHETPIIPKLFGMEKPYCTLALGSNAKWREIGLQSLKLDMKQLWNTLEVLKIASEILWKFGILTLRPFTIWPLRRS